MTPLISGYVVCACLFGLTTALAALCVSQRARQWLFAQVWASGGGASCVDAQLRDAKRTLLNGIAGRVLDVGSGEGVNLQYLAVLTRTCLGPHSACCTYLRHKAACSQGLTHGADRCTRTSLGCTVVYHRYLAVTAVTEIVCIEPNPYLQKRLRAAARAVVEERRARRGPPLSVRVYAGTLCEYADEESLLEFDAIVCERGQSAPSLAAPQLGSCASSARAWRLRAAQHFREEASPLSVRPLPRLLELAASNAADVAPAFALTLTLTGGSAGLFFPGSAELPGAARRALRRRRRRGEAS